MEIGVDIDIFQDTREGKLSMKNNKILSEADYIAKEHYKMYKAGKKWMVAGITAVSILGAVAMAEGTASADQVANTTSGTDPAVVKVDQTAVASQSATTVTLSASASVSSVASEVPAVTEVSASSEVVSSVVASEAVSSSSDVESSVAPASVSASVEASSSVSVSVTPVASVSASVESSTVVESSSVVESVPSSVAPVVNGHDSVAMSSMMSSAESAKAAGSIVTMRAVLAQATVSASTAGTIAKVADVDNAAGNFGVYDGTGDDPHHLNATTSAAVASHFTVSGDAKVSGSAVTMTDGNYQAGGYAFNQKVDMRSNWSIQFQVSLGSLTHDQSQVADFIGLTLMDQAPTSVATAAQAAADAIYSSAIAAGKSKSAAASLAKYDTSSPAKGSMASGTAIQGGGLGILGVGNAYSWGFDHYYNADFGDDLNAGSYKYKTSGLFGGTTYSMNAEMVGLRTTDASGNLMAATANKDTLGSSAVLGFGTTDGATGGSLASLGTTAGSSKDGYTLNGSATVTWDAATKTLTVSMGSYKRSFVLANVSDAMAIAVLGKTGGSSTTQSAIVTSFQTNLATVDATVNYVDGQGKTLAGLDTTTLKANAGDTITVANSATKLDGNALTTSAPKVAGYVYNGLTAVSKLADGTTTTVTIAKDAKGVMTKTTVIKSA